MTEETRAEEKIESEDIVDIDENDDEVTYVQYDITSYGADYTVDGLVARLRKEDIFIPDFQREYVWNQAEASRLIESLLLGLPIPGVFLAREADNRLLVIDGQQRLKSIQFFCDGFFNPKIDSKSKRIFKLVKVQKQFEGLTYEKLDATDRIKLDDSIIHATIIKQESPVDDNTSIYHVFERLNTGGRKLAPQEIRAAIYHGKFNNLISALNQLPEWRELFGPVNTRLKDHELILRFFATFYNGAKYSKPMVEFLNKFNLSNRNPSEEFLKESERIFTDTIKFIADNLGKQAFRPERSLNVAVFEAVTVGLARVLQRNNGKLDVQEFLKLYGSLIIDEDFLRTITSGTSDDSVFRERHRIVEEYFSNL